MASFEDWSKPNVPQIQHQLGSLTECLLCQQVKIISDENLEMS